MFPDLRRECATALADLDTDGYAVGGLSVGEPRPLSLEAVEATEDILPRSKPRYAMGVGMPAELPEYVARGVDMMDCVLPSRNARNGYLFHLRGARDHQAHALQGRRSGRSTPTAPATRAGPIPGPICAISSRRARFCIRYWPPGTTSSGTLTSCVRLGTL